MPAEDNNLVVGRFWQEVFEEKNLDVADELFASDHVLHMPDLTAEERGPYVMKGLVSIYHKVVPSIQLDLRDEIAAEDKVVSRWTARGSLADELKAARDNGDEVSIYGITIFRISEGEIKETWHQSEPLRNESEALRLPAEVSERWISDDEPIRGILGGPDPRWEHWICRICFCCMPEPTDAS